VRWSRDSSVGIVTHHGPNGAGSNPGRFKIFFLNNVQIDFVPLAYGYRERISSWVKRLGREGDHSSPYTRIFMA
jgi:hypothetical protein